jgi:hypothetical protein
MRIIITEEQFIKLNKGSAVLQNGINQYLNHYIKDGDRKIGKKSRSYGNLNEDWCVDGKEVISVRYNFWDGEFKEGSLFVPDELVKTLQSLFSVKKSFVLYVIEEWYDTVMVPKFEEIVGETGLSVDIIYIRDRIEACIPEPVKPEGITDEEMIDYIDKNTLYKRQEIINKITSGERELEDFYLDIVDKVEHRKQRPF